MDNINNKSDKGQIIILGSLFFAISLISLTLVINTFILADLSDSSNSDTQIINTIKYENEKIKENVIKGASPEAPLTPNEVRDNYVSFMFSYEANLQESLEENNIIYRSSSEKIKEAWEFGNINKSQLLNESGSSNWVISNNYNSIYKASFNLDINSTTDFHIIGRDSGGNKTWEMIVDSNKVQFLNEKTSNQDSVSVNTGMTEINIVNGTVNGSSVNTYIDTLENSEQMSFENGDSVGGIYRVQISSGANFQNPCSSPCISGDIYRTGILRSVSFNYELVNSEISTEKQLNISSNIDKMVIGND